MSGEVPFNPDDIVQPKSEERLQAQAEIFGDRGVKEFSADQAKLLKYSAELATIKDLDNLPADLAPEVVELVREYKDAYVDFLRRERKIETSFQEENIKNYKEVFEPRIAELQEQMAGRDGKGLAEYLGSGSNGSAFRIEAGGRMYAAKFFGHLIQANFEIKPLLRAKGILHVAQLAGYSFQDGVVIMELLPGRDVTSFTPDEAPKYSDDHIIQLIETAKELDANGLVIDPKPSNFMYDPDQGFSVLDFHLKRGPSNRYGLPEEIMDLRAALIARKYPPIDFAAADYQDKIKEHRLEEAKVRLPMMVRFLGILQERYPDILQAWKDRREEAKKDPRRIIPELIDRKHIPDDPDLAPYLEQLAAMGF